MNENDMNINSFSKSKFCGLFFDVQAHNQYSRDNVIGALEHLKSKNLRFIGDTSELLRDDFGSWRAELELPYSYFKEDIIPLFFGKIRRAIENKKRHNDFDAP